MNDQSTTLDLDALERAARDRVWIWFADNGNIRKWQTEPFAEGTEYLSRAEHDRIIAKQAAAARTLQASTLGQVRHLEEKDRSEYVAAATLDSEREANHRLTEEIRALQERVEGAEKALRPFADAPGLGGSWSDDEPISGYWADVSNSHSKSNAVTFGHLRAARAYFAARTKAGEPHEQE